MTTKNSNNTTVELPLFISTTDLLNQWLGHRRLTRRVVEAFPADKLFTHSIGGMRTFAEMMKEIIDISGPGIRGIATDDWENTGGFDKHTIDPEDSTKAGLLKLLDKSTEVITAYWSQIPEAKFQEHITIFGKYEGFTYSSILYIIDNEVHHRAQGVVYLRSLGVEPPAFWNRD